MKFACRRLEFETLLRDRTLKLRKLAHLIFAAAAVAGAAGYAAFSLSPWPRALLIRRDYDRSGAAVAAAMERHAPSGVSAVRDLVYDAAGGAAALDVYFPTGLHEGQGLPTVVWLHGGGWLAGDKRDVAGYLKLIAASGFVAVAVNYSLAPGAIYPTPVRQTFAALAFLTREAGRLHVDPRRLVLAGDSAGAQIAAQAAEIAMDPSYGRKVGVASTIGRDQLRGALLFCGVYDLALFDLGGPEGKIRRAYLRAYSGAMDFLNDPAFSTVSVARYLTPNFPPAFVSAGNSDPLREHSIALVDRLRGKGVAVDTLFYPADYAPPLQHEYQFDLDLDASKQALGRALQFLKKVTAAQDPAGRSE